MLPFLTYSRERDEGCTYAPLQIQLFKLVFHFEIKSLVKIMTFNLAYQLFPNQYIKKYEFPNIRYQ